MVVYTGSSTGRDRSVYIASHSHRDMGSGAEAPGYPSPVGCRYYLGVSPEDVIPGSSFEPLVAKIIGAIQVFLRPG
jgi:hypothetical protein